MSQAFEREEHNDDWLSLQEASELLGVAASTLRRWGDTGRVPMKKTLGGHRRFQRAAVVQLAGNRPAAEEAPPPWGVDARELVRQEWHTRLAARSDAGRMRGLGQRLLGLLIQYLTRREDDRRFLAEARLVGSNYGSEAREAAVSLHDTVEAFLFFRSSFAQVSVPLSGIARPSNIQEALGLQARISHFMDAVLLGVIAGYAGDAPARPGPSELP